ncbi:unnamed protein product, partial [Hymenolepis diminuta]
QLRGPTPHLNIDQRDWKQSLSRYLFCGERRYCQNYPIEDVATTIITTMAIKKISTENVLRTVERGRT